MSLLMLAVVVLFAPALLGFILLAGDLEVRVLSTPESRARRKAQAARRKQREAARQQAA